MSLEDLFGDLIDVPGVHGAILFQQKDAPKWYWPEDDKWQVPNDRFLRGARQIIRHLCRSQDRVELRYQRGRLIVQSLGDGSAVACFTDRELNLPLLNLTLTELARMAASSYKPVGSEEALTGSVETAVAASATSPVTETGAAGDISTVVPARLMSGQEAGPFPGDEVVSLPLSVAAVQSRASESGGGEYVEPLATHAHIAAGLSDISLIATGYLGRSLVNSCWRQTRPAGLEADFQISPDGMIEAENDLAAAGPEMIRLAGEWAQRFVARCQLVMIDLPLHLVAPLNADAQTLLAAGGSFGDRGLILLQYDYLHRLLSEPAPRSLKSEVS
ncbi:MAG TPA: hypothetical protein VFD58_17840 [Blastocatellia bacterium]|nr:hypothetical protein [Blastocatellia bacterium]